MSAEQAWLRLGTLLLLLGAEILALSVSFDVLTLSEIDNPWFAGLAQAGLLLKFAVVFIVAIPLGLGPRLSSHLSNLSSPTPRPFFSTPFIAHLGLYGALYALSWRLLSNPTFGAGDGPWLPMLWVLAGGLTGISWLVTVAPLTTWRTFVTAERTTLCLAAILAATTVAVALSANQLWAPLGQATFAVCVFLLNLIYPDIIVEPATYIIGTQDFLVQVGEQCSGYEGLALVGLFTVFYLSAFRNEFRFPQALLLLPIGLLAIWVLNAVRITLLIIIGHEISPAIAIGGFHSQAGWIFFVLVASLLLVFSHRFSFVRASAPVATSMTLNQPTALLLPLIVLLAMTLLTSALSADFNWLYPIRVIATGAIILYLWRYLKLSPRTSIVTPTGAGALVFLIWVLMVQPDADADAVFSHSLQNVGVVYAGLWLCMRVIGSVVTVPIAEELAFRGYLLNRIGGHDATDEHKLQFSLLAWVVSSLLFGLLHQAWLAGTLAGLIYGLIRYHRGSIMDAIIAHGTTNFLLFVYALTTGHWSVW